ncbi:BTB/POZ domain-containing protein, putative [Eimeria praecox]|uniref:BTB/POZ domain-containing protein, putative n=1 Tax=Eimeria praecox TaxID=51316 RepID=U6G908_9EIME|nr:BTB/POZ domain-containing protein, putative [Eimeria praecox]
MLNGPFREADAADIHLTDISPYAAHQMLLFIHTDTCEALKELKRTCTPDEKRQRREALMGLISAADKYDVQGLKEECEHQLAALVDEDSVLDVLLFAESRNFTRLLDAGQKLLQGMPALRLWTNWRNRQTGVPNQLPACETRESTGESCNNWGGADGPEMLSVCAAAAVS